MSKRESQKNKKPAEKLKILMIHGYRQNEAAFRERSGGMRKSLKSHAEFFFCEAPHVIPKKNCSIADEAAKNDEDAKDNIVEKGWWFSADDGSYNAHDYTSIQTGFNETLDSINKFCETNGPFDGVLGFSQGACLTSILSKISETNKNSEGKSQHEFIKFNFAIIVAGYRSRQSQHDIFYDFEKKITLPTLHIFGNGDKVIESDMSQELTNYFSEPSIFIHELGHFIPVNAESKSAFVEFLNKMKARKLDA